MVSFIQIQTFLEVARTESFTKASKQLLVPRSTISARIQALEESLNVALLNRTTRQVSLTHEGQRYYERCFEAIDTLKTLEQEFEDQEVLRGLIRVTIPIDLPKDRFVELLSDFHKQHPEVSFDVNVNDDLLDMVSENIDLALRGKSPGNDGLIARKFGAGKMVFVARSDLLPQKAGKSLARALDKMDLFDPTGMAASLGLSKERTFVRTKSFELTKSLVVHGKGVGFLPKTMCEALIEEGALCVLQTDLILPELPLYIVRPVKKHLPQRVRAFVDFLVKSNKE
ncbi:LysR family transcriptional regulator [Kiloniella majae]|uniref:LysR family transcriptional regulator n=1 Tax=Kiloniella majae TaxID=1938558 RepID=UPI000A27859C|nr:LysR family transcriptional regulator [Kiloniella majae]